MKRGNYRKIYEEYYKIKIPKGMHIHHIDGNRNNNDPLNLQMVTPEEHYKIHFERGDKLPDRWFKVPLYGENHPCYGKEFTKEHREKISAALSGVKHTDQRRKNISSSRANKPVSAKHLKVMKEAFSGEKNPMYGKNHKEDSKKRISKTRLERGIKPVNLISLRCIETGEIFSSMSKAANQYKISAGLMSRKLKNNDIAKVKNFTFEKL